MTETNPEEAQTLDISEKDIKLMVLKLLKEIKHIDWFFGVDKIILKQARSASCTKC